MAGVMISDGTPAGSVVGTEKIPVSGSGNPVITPDQIATYYGEWAAWTITFGGFSVNPTYTARYCKIGNLCHVYVNMTGTSASNATTFTITLPFAAANTVIQNGAIATVVDNGVAATTPGMIATTPNSTTANIYKTSNAGAWTNPGVKRCNFAFTYETT